MMHQPFALRKKKVSGLSKKSAQISTKVKGFAQAFFLERLAGSRGRARVALRRGRNPFADGINNCSASGQIRKSIKPPAP